MTQDSGYAATNNVEYPNCTTLEQVWKENCQSKESKILLCSQQLIGKQRSQEQREYINRPRQPSFAHQARNAKGIPLQCHI